MSAENFNAISVGTRRHVNHSVFRALPFDDEDFSYALAYEYHESAGYWQIAVDYAPDASGMITTNLSDSTDYVVTPQINLILKDRGWLGGVGALWSYIEDKNEGGAWTDQYWQLLAGFHLPLFRVHLDVNAYYVFEDWQDLDEFDAGDIDFAAWLRFTL